MLLSKMSSDNGGHLNCHQHVSELSDCFAAVICLLHNLPIPLQNCFCVQTIVAPGVYFSPPTHFGFVKHPG